MNLSEIKPGCSGVIKSIGSEGHLRRRIVDMGLTAGTCVEVVRYAPLGDPIEINIHGYNLSIRKSEAEEINIFESNKEYEQFLQNTKNNSEIKEKSVVPLLSSPPSSNSGMTVALIGNPNSGKTTLFNNLTGSYQYVGNWPGVTVERKEGKIKNISEDVTLVDLPGIYSLSPYSPEEIITRQYILEENPNLIINILDATNLERGLYLTTQLLELDLPVIAVLNMEDLLFSKGKVIDYKKLEKSLGIPIVPISASKNKGIDNLIFRISSVFKNGAKSRSIVNIYSDEIESSLKEIDRIVNNDKNYIRNNRFKIIKVFEDDMYVTESLKISLENLKKIDSVREKLSEKMGKESDMIIPDERYKYICSLCDKVIKNVKNKNVSTFTGKVDKILTGKYTAFPSFIIFIFSIFYITFGPIGSCLKTFCENFINGNTYSTMNRILEYFGASGWCRSLVLDAIIGGVGSVVSFLPQVILLFVLLSLLEDCGYMSRAAFIMDKPLRRIGLSGKAFVPLIMGFGCSVPAIMSTKILENKKDKNLAVFLIPFMSCSAKMPVYLLFESEFFPKHQAVVIFSLYTIGILVAIFTAWIFKENLFKGEDSPFIMEMPDYKFPSLKNVWLSVWDKIEDFIERAGTIILLATIVVWILQSFNFNFEFVSDNSQSMLANLGGFIAPVFSICGFGNWQASVSLITGIMAKESIVSTLSVLHGADNSAELSEFLKSSFSVCSAISFMVFSLLYTPCVAALSALHKEFRSFKLTFISVLYQLFVAYLFSALTFQILSLIFKCINL
ncbi:MAG: ferrous iron transport protein B [Clostridia bacterium]|nr:ferrous iron transport protein B [Clostridia bacterium]